MIFNIYTNKLLKIKDYNNLINKFYLFNIKLYLEEKNIVIGDYILFYNTIIFGLPFLSFNTYNLEIIFKKYFFFKRNLHKSIIYKKQLINNSKKNIKVIPLKSIISILSYFNFNNSKGIPEPLLLLYKNNTTIIFKKYYYMYNLIKIQFVDFANYRRIVKLINYIFLNSILLLLTSQIKKINKKKLLNLLWVKFLIFFK